MIGGKRENELKAEKGDGSSGLAFLSDLLVRRWTNENARKKRESQPVPWTVVTPVHFSFIDSMNPDQKETALVFF